MKAEVELEEKHGHCAHVLMEDFGIPQDFRLQVLEGIDALYQNPGYIHCQILLAIRGFCWRTEQTLAFKSMLLELATHEQLNSKEAMGKSTEEV